MSGYTELLRLTDISPVCMAWGEIRLTGPSSISFRAAESEKAIEKRHVYTL